MLGPSFSLTLALRSVAESAGYDVDADDLHAVLGLSMVACAAPGDMELGNWPLYARDAFLVDTARVFGMTVRPIHPPEAARGLGGAAEFAQHFDASYRPLIARALEHDQPVLTGIRNTIVVDVSDGTVFDLIRVKDVVLVAVDGTHDRGLGVEQSVANFIVGVVSRGCGVRHAHE